LPPIEKTIEVKSYQCLFQAIVDGFSLTFEDLFVQLLDYLFTISQGFEYFTRMMTAHMPPRIHTNIDATEQAHLKSSFWFFHLQSNFVIVSFFYAGSTNIYAGSTFSTPAAQFLKFCKTFVHKIVDQI
jgi:hypothetical protein